MTSEVFVWIYLPAHDEPVVCGRLLALDDGAFSFLYGRTYRDRDDAIALARKACLSAQMFSSAAGPAPCPDP